MKVQWNSIQDCYFIIGSLTITYIQSSSKKEGRIQELGGLIYMIDISARGNGFNMTKCLFNNSQWKLKLLI